MQRAQPSVKYNANRGLTKSQVLYVHIIVLLEIGFLVILGYICASQRITEFLTKFVH